MYVLSGEFTVRTEASTVVMGPSQSHLIPQSIVHSVAIASAVAARSLVVASPSGFAHLIETVGTASDGSDTPPASQSDMEAFMRVSAEIGEEILVPPCVSIVAVPAN